MRNGAERWHGKRTPMGLFKRTALPRSTDEHLTYFTVAQANDFRRLVGRSFGAAGRDVAVYPDRVEDSGGTTFGLWNIGALCSGSEPQEWQGLIDDHVRLVTTPARALSDLSREELEAGLHLRLVEASTVPDPDTLGYARMVAPGLLEVLSVDLQDSVATPTSEELETRGTLAEAVGRGRTNLRSLLLSDDVRAEIVAKRSRGRFTIVSGDSPFTASLALLLPEAMQRFTAETDAGRGVLVAMPSRHQLLYRVIDGKDAALALQHMLKLAVRGYREPGALSRNVYWVRNHRWVQATTAEGDKPKVLSGTGLSDTFRRVVAD
jgi:hypothetical protein